jgi:hypothetical protein
MGTKAGTFTGPSCDSSTNAVKVTARMRGDLSQGSVAMTLARIFGVNTVNPSATAIAAIGNLVTLPKGSAGGFLGVDHDYMKKAYDLYQTNPNQKFYIVLQMSGGQLSYQFADNGSFALPAGTTPFNPTVGDYIKNGTSQDISVSNSVDLKNGQMANLVMDLQQKVNDTNGQGLDLSVYGVYADALGQGGDAWNEANTPIDSFWDITVTNVWKSQELRNDPNAAAIIDQIYGIPLNQQQLNQIVGLIEFKMRGPGAYAGAAGNTLPSNTFGFIVKLVQ